MRNILGLNDDEALRASYFSLSIGISSSIFSLLLLLFTPSVPFTTEAKIQQYELQSYQVVMLVMLVLSQKLIQKVCPTSNQMKKVKVRWRAFALEIKDVSTISV